MRLNYQISDYDSGPTCLLNSLKILYKRDEIPIKLIKIIYFNTLDISDKYIYDNGTSRFAMKRICNKFNIYGNKHNMDIFYMYYAKDEVDFSKIEDALSNNKIVIIRNTMDIECYFMITNIDNEYVYIWDPRKDDNDNIIFNNKIEKDLVNNTKVLEYSLGPIEKRELIIASKCC